MTAKEKLRQAIEDLSEVELEEPRQVLQADPGNPAWIHKRKGGCLARCRIDRSAEDFVCRIANFNSR